MALSDDLNLTDALRVFEATEANVTRLESLWSAIEGEFPTGNVFQPASETLIGFGYFPSDDHLHGRFNV